MSDANVYFAQELIVHGKNNVVMDISSAARYGTIRNVLTSQIRPSLAPGPALNIARKELLAFRPETDFICAAGGDPLSLPIVLLALRDLGFKRVQFLRWEKSIGLDGRRDAKSGFYSPMTLPLFL